MRCFSSPGQKLFGIFLTFFCLLLAFSEVQAQRRRPARTVQPKTSVTQPVKRQMQQIAVVVDERLAVLRFEPSLSSIPMQRMRSGRTMLVLENRRADGVIFYRVQLPPEKGGWVQADAVVTNFKNGDDARLAQLIRASSGYEQIERTSIFLENFPHSPFRPAILLLMGDLAEAVAQRLSRDATRRLDVDEMRANGAPLHSFYLNYSGLDRYRKLGVNFVFNTEAKQFHYDGASWREIVKKYPNSYESQEARKRLDSLTEKSKLSR